jgi:two-component system CheB/CheR fusion protein
MTRGDDGSIEDLLEYLKSSRGFDFTGYKRTSLQRRISKRMQAVDVARFDDYIDFLEVHPDEFPQLFDTILINLTAFFRDPDAWAHLASEAIPMIDRARGGVGQIRVWSAGCASGEEAYTLAMLFAETLGREAFEDRVKVYATDVDEDALSTARHGVYSSKQVEAIPVELRKKYFDQEGSRFSFNKILRRAVIFGRHDLVQDAPISRLDLLVCRNTLMYFNAALQEKILRNFHFALVDHGLLLLGKAETMLTHNELFTPVDLKHRLFQRVARSPLQDRLGSLPDSEGSPLSRRMLLRDAAIDAGPVAQLLVDVEGLLLLANQQARASFGVGEADIGRPFQDLELSYRPLELRSRIETAYAERRPVQVTNVDRAFGSGDVQSFDVTVAPIFDPEGSPLGVTVSFADVTRYRRLRQELERSNQELETAYEELQSTNEELETTNEELQSTVEELETTNEELQSSNEELETTNEELQSTNAEIQAMNDDMRQRASESGRVVSLTEGILSSLAVAVFVVDRNMRILSWNTVAVEMWGLRFDEVEGQELRSLDSGLPVAELEEPIERAFRGDAVRFTVEAVNRRGRKIVCNVSCSHFTDDNGALEGVVVLMGAADGN